MPGLEIVDGTGGGHSAQVSENNHIVAETISETKIRRINHRLGTVWSVNIPGITPTGANDLFFYLKNTGSEDLTISDIYLSSSVATQVEVIGVSGTPTYNSSSDANYIPRNLGSTETPNAIIKTDTDITGLTEDGVLHYIQIPVAGTEYSFKGSAGIIIPKGKAIALKRVAATGALTGTITLFKELYLSSARF